MRFSVPDGWESDNFNYEEIHTIFVYPPEDGSADAPFMVTENKGGPETTTFLYSTESEARWIKDESGNPIGIDSRGRERNGEIWRNVQYYEGDIAIYNSLVRSRAKRILAYRVIDSACIAPVNNKPQ